MTALLETRLGLPLFARGKVRDTYELPDRRLLMIATDRISAFDHILPTGIPDRGNVLTQLSIFWFRRTGHLQENHLIEPGDDGRSMVVRRADASRITPAQPRSERRCGMRPPVSDAPSRARGRCGEAAGRWGGRLRFRA